MTGVQTCALPIYDENRIQSNVQQTAAHGADAGVEGRALGAHHIGHHHVEDGGGGAAGGGPEHILAGGIGGDGVRPQQGQQRDAEHRDGQREQQTAHQGTIKPDGRAFAHRVIEPS